MICIILKAIFVILIKYHTFLDKRLSISREHDVKMMKLYKYYDYDDYYIYIVDK